MKKVESLMNHPKSFSLLDAVWSLNLIYFDCFNRRISDDFDVLILVDKTRSRMI